MGVAVVVGGGFSGVIAARELLRGEWSVIMVDPGLSPGRGLAYGTSEPWHLLNSPVASMSADPDRPTDFLDWCRRTDHRLGGAPVQPTDFVPRAWYGDYLTETLRATESVLWGSGPVRDGEPDDWPPDAEPGGLTIHRGRVSRIFEASGPGLTVLLDDGVVIPADKVVLALGHATPSLPVRLPAEVRTHPGYVADPWRPGALDRVQDGPVLLVGTGLTAVDVALTLANRAVAAVELTAVSRHGLLPQPHRPAGEPPAPVRSIELDLLSAGSLAALTRSVRLLAQRVGDWRAVMDALRPHWDRLWQGLSEPDQRRFLRHLARYWEVHRHRMAPPVAAAIERLRLDGALRVRSAELCGVSVAESGGLRVVLRHRGGTAAVTENDFAAVINCTGPGRLVDSDPLVRSLIADGLARCGPYNLGLDVDEHGAALGRDGRAGRGDRAPALYVLGPPRRGRLWETAAAPEIRTQARALATHLRGRGALGSRCVHGDEHPDPAYALPG